MGTVPGVLIHDRNGVVTGSPAKGQQWSRDYGFPETNIFSYDTMAKIANNPDIDIVYVVTPNSLHAEHAIKVAQAGKHVICEKPMASSVADCEAMIAACAKANVKLSIGYRLQFDPYHIELDRLARHRPKEVRAMRLNVLDHGQRRPARSPSPGRPMPPRSATWPVR